MEFPTLDEAVAYAQRIGLRTNQARIVLQASGPNPYFVCDARAKRDLWPDRKPIYIVNPHRLPKGEYSCT